jgi:hypothetical protein
VSCSRECHLPQCDGVGDVVFSRGREFYGTISLYWRRLSDARHVSHSNQEPYDGAIKEVGQDVFERERMAFRGEVYLTVCGLIASLTCQQPSGGTLSSENTVQGNLLLIKTGRNSLWFLGLNSQMP